MPDLQSRVDAYLNAAVEKGFAGAIVVARGGEAILASGYGLADRANAVPVTPATVFNIGELTRHFTIAAILKLVERGGLATSDTLARFFTDVPPDKAGITVEQLLRHESGISARAGSYRYDFVTRGQFLAQLFREPLSSAPGSGQYANAGYILLAAIVEQVSGQSFESFLRDSLFEPAGMSQTGYVLPRWDTERLAHSYFFDIHLEGWVDWGTTRDQFGEGVSWYAIGKGDMQSTAEDLLAWQLSLREGAILSPGSIERLNVYLQPQQPGDTSYYIEASNGHYQAEMIHVVEDDLLVISVNSLNRDVPVGRTVTRMAAEADYEPPPFPADPYELLFEFMRGHAPEDAEELPSWFSAYHHDGLKDPALLHPVGIMQMNKGDHAWAIALLALNVRLFPLEGDFWDSLGEAYLAGGQRELALASFREALVRAPPGDCFWCLNARTRLSTLDAQSP